MTKAYGIPLIRREGLLAVCALFLLAAAPAHAPTRLLVLGDSLAAGYGLAPEAGFQALLAQGLAARGWPVVIEDGAVSGDTSAGGRARLDWLLGDDGAAAPEAALVELGANDGLRGTPPEEMEANLGAILDKLAARHIPVLLCGMYAPPNMGSEYGARFRAVFTRLAERPGVIFEPFFLDGVAGDPALAQPDHLHPNEAGETRVVAQILPYAERLLALVGH
jgi:acyl-CoA thioesterase-1